MEEDEVVGCERKTGQRGGWESQAFARAQARPFGGPVRECGTCAHLLLFSRHRPFGFFSPRFASSNAPWGFHYGAKVQGTVCSTNVLVVGMIRGFKCGGAPDGDEHQNLLILTRRNQNSRMWRCRWRGAGSPLFCDASRLMTRCLEVVGLLCILISHGYSRPLWRWHALDLTPMGTHDDEGTSPQPPASARQKDPAVVLKLNVETL